MGKKLLLLQQQGAASEVQGLYHLEEEPLLHSKRREDSEEQSFRIGKYTYRAGSDGRIKVGVHKWGKYYYYSTSSGKLRKKAGRITWKGKSYYSRKSGTLYTNRFYFSGSNIYYAGPKALPSPAPLRWENTPTLRTHPDPLSLRIGNI